MHVAHKSNDGTDKGLAEQDLIRDLNDPSKKERAFTSVLDRYQKELYWYIRKIVLIHEDADDVLQNTFLKIYKNIESFKGNSKLRTWMYTIAYRESMNLLEVRRKKTFVGSEEANNYILHSLQEDVHFVGSEIQLKLHEALLSLPNKQREVFQMKYFDDLKFREIAEIMGTSEGALKASYYIAVKKIESQVTNQLF